MEFPQEVSATVYRFGGIHQMAEFHLLVTAQPLQQAPTLADWLPSEVFAWHDLAIASTEVRTESEATETALIGPLTLPDRVWPPVAAEELSLDDLQSIKEAATARDDSHLERRSWHSGISIESPCRAELNDFDTHPGDSVVQPPCEVR